VAKTGADGELGTAEGALFGRAAHALYAKDPIVADDWAIELLSPAWREPLRAAPPPAPAPGEPDHSPFLAINIGSLRYAEDEVARCLGTGIRQYVILGAGFDTFALRHAGADGLTVFEIDHPDVQALKRSRIEAAARVPVSLPVFVPVDFETTSLAEGLGSSSFDPGERTVVSWMNTIPYLSESAVRGTLEELHGLMALGSRLALNYTCDVPFSERQIEFLKTLQGTTLQSGEPLRSRFTPEAFEALLSDVGFSLIDHATERDLHQRYFAGRDDGLDPNFPARIVTAERR